MPKAKVSKQKNKDSVINVCDTTTLAPTFEQQDDEVKPHRTIDFTGCPNNKHGRARRKLDRKHAYLEPEKLRQEVPVHTYRFGPYSNAADMYCLNQFVNGMNNAGEGDDDYSSDEEFHDSLHRQFNKSTDHGEQGASDDDNKTAPTVQETSGSKSKVPEEIRLRINSRERQRMHDLNSALDSLRQVMPYSSGASVKKLSKMSTLLLARNYIVMLTRSLEEMKRLVQEMSTSRRPPPPPPPPTTLPPPPPSTTSPTVLSQPRLSVPTALSSLPFIPNPSAYAALLSSHPTTPGGFILPTSLFQIPHLLPASTLAHHHHIAGMSGCVCYYCKKFRTAVPTS